MRNSLVILNWAIEGALLWQKEGLEMPRKIRYAVAEYRTEEDTLANLLVNILLSEVLAFFIPVSLKLIKDGRQKQGFVLR